MTQITVTLGEDANPSIIRQVLENMKGVLKVSIKHDKNSPTQKNIESSEWRDELNSLLKNIDYSAIDINEERTRHILRGSELLKDLEREK